MRQIPGFCETWRLCASKKTVECINNSVIMALPGDLEETAKGHLPCGMEYTLEYYSATKKNEMMPFAATWIGLEMIILSGVSQTEKDKYHMISLKCRFYIMAQMNLTYKTEADLQTQRTDLWLPRRGLGEGWIGSLGLADTNYYIKDRQTTRSYCIA